MLAGVRAEVDGDDAVDITDLAYDSRRVEAGALFFAVTGELSDGHEHAAQAVASGAAALVVERALGLGVPEARVGSARAAMAPAAVRFFRDPTARLPVAGITGTNGKTTSAFLLRHLLVTAGVATGLLGTVKSVVGGVEAELARTTPEAIDLQSLFRAMLDAGDGACAMEVSSHALAIGRTAGVRFAVGAFTNLTQDHLDFHPSMTAYYAAKRKLFEAEPRLRVVNRDDEWGRRLIADFPDAMTYGMDDVSGLETGRAGSRFAFDGREWTTPLPGPFNVLNCLAAIHAARALGADDAGLVRALARIGQVPGRFEPVDEGQDFAVVVDYSHTPDSLENVLRAARGMAAGRVVCVFGCGGDRDRGKRPIMGRIASELADVAIVTSDNPRSEDPEEIIREVLAGMEGGAEAIVDRREAIARAVERAGPGDVVVIAGKGHEQGQEFADGVKKPFDDVTVARDALNGVRPTIRSSKRTSEW